MTRANGFTLVELLFALLLSSLLLTVLGWAIRGLEEQYRRHAVLGAAETVEAITPFLEAELGRALPPVDGSSFEGNETRMTLVVPPPKALGPVGPVRLALEVVSTAVGKALIARFGAAGDKQRLPNGVTTPVTLADGFRAIRLSYLRRATDAPSSLPRLITIQFVAKDGTILPLGIEPRLTMTATCVFDPISLTCRR